MGMTRGICHHRHRALHWVVAAAGVVALAGAGAFGFLLMTTPSVGQAMALAQAQARVHGIKYPAPQPPSRFTDALVATEDHRFYSPIDPGIDPFAIVRVILGRIMGLRDQGGSTIDQQLAKMLYTPGRSGYLAVDLDQIAIALKLHFAYARAQILSLYAQVAYFGAGYYGLAAASCGYFGRPPTHLTWPEAAMLAGVVNAPNADNPRRHPKNAHAREAHVFRRLISVGDLTRAQAAAALSQPLRLVIKATARMASCA